MCLESPLRGLRVVEEAWPGKLRKEAELEEGEAAWLPPSVLLGQ